MKTELEALWKTYDTVNEWIRFSDTKAVAILAVNGVLAGFIFSNLKEIWLVLSAQPAILTVLIVSIFTCSASVLFCICCLAPTLKVDGESSLIFFDHVAKNYEKAGEYEAAILQKFKDDSEVVEQVASQIWANSKVASKKYDAVMWSTRFFLGTVALFIIGIAIMVASRLV